MLNVRTILESQLTPGTQILVRGKVSYSHVATIIEGEELQENIKRQSAQGRTPITKPYTTISVYNAQIVPKAQNGQLAPDEIFVQERFFTSSKQEQPGWNYTANSKSPYLPEIYEKSESNPNVVNRTTLTGEFARGMDVILVLRVYHSNQYRKNAIGLDGVIAQEKIRYYSSNNMANLLASRGFIVQESQNGQAPAPQQPQQAAQAPAGAAPATGYPTSMENHPNGNMFLNQPANGVPGMNPPETPNPYQPNPVPNPYQAGNPNSFPAAQAPATPANDGNAQRAGGNNPYASNFPNYAQGPASPGGIQYNPNDNSRDY